MKRKAKWVEVKTFSGCEKRIIVDVNNDNSCLCVIDGDEDSYINGGRYDTHEWNEYREIKEPVYKPYKELTEEVRNKLRGVWIKSKISTNEYQITGFILNQNQVELGGCEMSLGELFGYWTFLNGDTIGELEN